MPLPNKMNPLAREPVFTLTVKPGILGTSLTYGFTPLWRAGGYCKVIDWGDGTSEDAVTNQASISHTYSSAGTYKIKVKADCYKFYFGLNTAYAPLIYDSNGNWDAIGDLTNASEMFSGCANAVFALKSLPSGLTGASSMFRGCANARLSLTSLPAGITGGSYMFDGCANASISITTLPSGLTNGAGMFRGCANSVMNLNTLAANAPTGGWTALTNIAQMFQNCSLVTGSQSAFLAQCPNVTNTTNAFTGTNTTA